jgi:hypothetical protein
VALAWGPGSPLRGDDGAFDPLFKSMVAIMLLVFLACGLGYGIGAGVIKSDKDAVTMAAKGVGEISSYLVLVFFAAIFALVFIGAWVLSKVRKRAISASLKNRIVNGYLSLLSLGFLTLATTALEPFGCRLEKDNKWTLVADPSRLCFEGWWKQLVPFAVAGIVVYILGIPLTVLWWLRRNRSNLTDPDFVERYGGLYSSYSPSLSHWEPIVMAEKVLIAAIGLLLSGFVMLQVMLLQVVFVVTLSLYQSYSPYVRGKDNRLHAILRGRNGG